MTRPPRAPQALPSTSSSFKSIAATKKEIADHYDMGNDFFGAARDARRAGLASVPISDHLGASRHV